MPYANNDGVRIYYEAEGEGAPFVLLPGFIGSLEYWRAFGYVDALKSSYRVILIDPRGHGRSDKPHGVDAYNGPALAADVTAVLDAEGFDKAHFWGYSRGGSIGFLLAKYAPTRLTSLITGGIGARSSQGTGGTAKLLEIGIEAVVDAITSEPAFLPHKSLIASNDVAALLACAYAPGEAFDDVYATMDMPCLMYAGEQDPTYLAAQETVRKIPNAAFVGLPSLNHLQGWPASQAVLTHVLAFLDKAKAG